MTLPGVEELLEQVLNELKALREEVAEMHEDFVDLLSEDEEEPSEEADDLDSQVDWNKAE